MPPSLLGVVFYLSFVTLESFQAVYLGSVFQDVDSFQVGAWVFGISTVGCTLATAILRPQDLLAALQAWRIVSALNIFAAVAWILYFTAIQLIEPAVVFTIFSGTVPLVVVIAGWFGVPEARALPTRLADTGHAAILVSILVLAASTVFGLSGFVRGGWIAALTGVSLSAVSGTCMAFVTLYAIRLDARGVGPLAQFGLRFVLYTALAVIAFLTGLDDKGDRTSPLELAGIVTVGLLVIAFPLYLFQRAVPLVSAHTIAAMTALGPAMVFVMQSFDGRVTYSTATLFGLSIYMTGAVIGSYASSRPTARSVPDPR